MDSWDVKFYTEYRNRCEWMKGLRLNTVMQVCQAVGSIENVFLDNSDQEPVTLDEAIEWVYSQFVSDCDHYVGSDRSAMFDGKDKILNAIKHEILNSEEILIKEAL